MSNGSVIKVYVPRLHRTNARETMEECKSMMKYLSNRLLSMAANAGIQSVDGVHWHEYVATEVPPLLEEYADNAFKCILARRMEEAPEDCEDDYDETE